MLPVFIGAFIYSLVSWIYFEQGIFDFKKGNSSALKESQKCEGGGFCRGWISQRRLSLSLLIRIGWIPPKRLRSKYEVSAVDPHRHARTHTHAHTHTHTRTHTVLKQNFNEKQNNLAGDFSTVGSWIFGFSVKFYPPDPSVLIEDITR